MKTTKTKEALLLLHCKCNACTSWEIVYDPNTNKYFLQCASCPERIEISIYFDRPQASLHWEVLPKKK